MSEQKKVPLLLWPFVAIWQFIGFILNMAGRLVAVILGVVMVIVGLVLALTIAGAFIGIPMALFGMLIIFRGLF